jgi:hypothetical protein
MITVETAVTNTDLVERTGHTTGCDAYSYYLWKSFVYDLWVFHYGPGICFDTGVGQVHDDLGSFAFHGRALP